MHFTAVAHTDIGISKSTNQDSLLIKQAKYGKTEILMVVICDGMGGLAKGELASAEVIVRFSDWFKDSLPYKLKKLDMKLISQEWVLMLKKLNSKILKYSKEKGFSMGTTFTGVLFIGNEHLIVHVGDTRVYQISSKLNQLTTDHTFVAQEIRRGNMTVEQAKVDSRRNMLLQCIGAVSNIDPQVIVAKTKKSVYMLCSDGFRHEISEQEIYKHLNPAALADKDTMLNNIQYLVNLVKNREEKDNISAILVKVQ